MRDYATAEMCAFAGASLIGLQTRHLNDSAKASTLIELVDRSPTLPSLGLVAVTQSNAIDEVLGEVRALRPRYVQLHSPGWNSESIGALRLALDEMGHRETRIIAFAKVATPPRVIRDVAAAADALLLDMTDYLSPRPGAPPTPDEYRDSAALSDGRPVIVAGGLESESVRRYIAAVHPWGVDVQRGVEFIGPGGRKDPTKLSAFVQAVRQADEEALT